MIRLTVPPLSPAGVEKLAEGHNHTVDELYATTGGNPFFLTEVLAANERGVPGTVRDAVLARCAVLSTEAHALVEAAAVVPQPTDLWLLRALAPEGIEPLDECLSSGILTSRGSAVVFRHELARTVVESSLPVHRCLALHERALAALEAPPSGEADLARLAHHAEGAGDVAATLRYAPLAGERAEEFSAYREAAAEYLRALRVADGQPLEVRADLWSRRSIACFITGDSDEAIEAREQALACCRELGDGLGEGDSLRWLSRLDGCRGRIAEGVALAAEAVEVLERSPAGPELAMAYSNRSSFVANRDDLGEAERWGERAIELAESIGETEVLIHAAQQRRRDRVPQQQRCRPGKTRTQPATRHR